MEGKDAAGHRRQEERKEEAEGIFYSDSKLDCQKQNTNTKRSQFVFL